jgi:hypothetical protein
MRFSVKVGDTYEDIKKKERLFLKNVVKSRNIESSRLINIFEKEIKKYYLLKIKTLEKS